MTIPFDPFGRLPVQLLAMALDPSKKWNPKRSGLEESMVFWWCKQTEEARDERGKEEEKEGKKKGKGRDQLVLRVYCRCQIKFTVQLLQMRWIRLPVA